MINFNEIIVNVCMITYNHAEYLDKAIQGVLIQKTNFKVELIISDDASPDQTEDVVNRYLNYSNSLIKIVYHKHPENIGAIPNFEWTLMQCSGKYIAICDGDDYWTDPNKLQRQVDFLERNNNYVLSFHERAIINSDGEIIKNKSLSNSIKRDLNFGDLALGIFTIPTQTVLFRNCIQNFPQNFSSVLNGDTFLFLLLAEKGSFYFDKVITGTVYRIHDGGIWSSINYEKSLLESYNTYKILYHHFKQHQALRETLLNRSYGLISFYWKNNNFHKFSRQLINILFFVILNPVLIVGFLTKSVEYIFKPLDLSIK